MNGIFAWIRRQVKEAVLGGFADAVQSLHRADDPAALLEERPATLPAPEDGQDEPVANGRRRKG